MDTINNVASAASRAIWGEQEGGSTTEPVSGKTGNTAAGEPYDAGNSTSTNSGPHDSDIANKADPTVDSDRDSSNTAGKNISSSDKPGNTSSTGPIRSEHETDKTGVVSGHQPTSGFSSDKPTSSNVKNPGAEPSVGSTDFSGGKGQKQQGADRPHETPSSSEHEAIKAAKQEAEEAQNTDTSSPGPAPLESHGKTGAGGSSGGSDDGPQKESHGEGTGEKYVKSSGMKADGGDFDAANPGAGKEADRLLETKGVHREAEPTKSDSKEDPLEAKLNKPSLKEKIMNKIHKK